MAKKKKNKVPNKVPNAVSAKSDSSTAPATLNLQGTTGADTEVVATDHAVIGAAAIGPDVGQDVWAGSGVREEGNDSVASFHSVPEDDLPSHVESPRGEETLQTQDTTGAAAIDVVDTRDVIPNDAATHVAAEGAAAIEAIEEAIEPDEVLGAWGGAGVSDAADLDAHVDWKDPPKPLDLDSLPVASELPAVDEYLKSILNILLNIKDYPVTSKRIYDMLTAADALEEGNANFTRVLDDTRSLPDSPVDLHLYQEFARAIGPDLVKALRVDAPRDAMVAVAPEDSLRIDIPEGVLDRYLDRVFCRITDFIVTSDGSLRPEYLKGLQDGYNQGADHSVTKAKDRLAGCLEALQQIDRENQYIAKRLPRVSAVWGEFVTIGSELAQAELVEKAAKREYVECSGALQEQTALMLKQAEKKEPDDKLVVAQTKAKNASALVAMLTKTKTDRLASAPPSTAPESGTASEAVALAEKQVKYNDEKDEALKNIVLAQANLEKHSSYASRPELLKDLIEKHGDARLVTQLIISTMVDYASQLASGFEKNKAVPNANPADDIKWSKVHSQINTYTKNTQVQTFIGIAKRYQSQILEELYSLESEFEIGLLVHREKLVLHSMRISMELHALEAQQAETPSEEILRQIELKRAEMAAIDVQLVQAADVTAKLQQFKNDVKDPTRFQGIEAMALAEDASSQGRDNCTAAQNSHSALLIKDLVKMHERLQQLKTLPGIQYIEDVKSLSQLYESYSETLVEVRKLAKELATYTTSQERVSWADYALWRSPKPRLEKLELSKKTLAAVDDLIRTMTANLQAIASMQLEPAHASNHVIQCEEYATRLGSKLTRLSGLLKKMEDSSQYQPTKTKLSSFRRMLEETDFTPPSSRTRHPEEEVPSPTSAAASSSLVAEVGGSAPASPVAAEVGGSAPASSLATEGAGSEDEADAMDTLRSGPGR